MGDRNILIRIFINLATGVIKLAVKFLSVTKILSYIT